MTIPQAPSMRDTALRHLRWSCLLLLAAATAVYASYRHDCATLKRVALSIVPDECAAEHRILALLGYVHAIPKTAENTRFFLLPGLRATPLQVLEDGGDCADKSRLLSSMLRQAGLSATMLMCFDAAGRVPTHTVVCADLPSGGTMVVDPAYGLFFPTLGGSGYFGLSDLRKDQTILERRLSELREILPRSSPIHAYNAASASYAFASPINWNKNGLTRLAGKMLSLTGADDIHAWPRPYWLEEPKLLLALTSLAAAMVMAVLPMAAERCRRLLARLAAHGEPAPALAL